MRKNYLDNIRWVTVVLVVIYHVIYMYNAEGLEGVVGPISGANVQYWDIYQYVVYPWFMLILFIVAGICSKLYLDNHTEKEFAKSRTTKLLVPSTIGVLVFGFVQGYVNCSLSNAGKVIETVPPFVGYLIMAASGIGVLWFIQMLWLFSMALLLVRMLDKGRLLELGAKVNATILILFTVLIFGSAQILNMPIICCYRFGIYFVAFFLGYFVFAHDEVMKIVKKWFFLFFAMALILGAAFCISYFGQNYADKPVNRTILYSAYGWFASLSILGGFAKYFNFENGFTKWVSSRSWGLYVFHYLGISSVGLFLAKPGIIPAWAAYLLSLIAGFALAYALNFIISRLPFFRWAVLGIRKKS